MNHIGTIIGTAVVISATSLPLASIAGCSVEDIVRVKTPPAVQAVFDQPPSMSYREAGQQQQIVAETTKTALTQWGTNYDDAGEWVGLIGGLSGVAYEQYGPMVQAAAGIGGPFATFLAGWLLIRKPGTVPIGEKIDSFNEGEKRAESRAAKA